MVNPNGPAPFAPNASQPWGLVSLDWNVGSSVWNASGPHVATVEATSRANCRALRAVHPDLRCFIYHNMELALEALESQRLGHIICFINHKECFVRAITFNSYPISKP
jgi:hypothetical protein